MSEKRHEIAVYQSHCTMSGRVCPDPERVYGEDWRHGMDLMVFEGTEAELREYFAGTSGWLARAGRAVLDRVG